MASIEVWATPVNTLLIIVLTILTHKLNRRAKSVQADVKSVAAIAGDAADASDSAARIAKDIGSIVRDAKSIEVTMRHPIAPPVPIKPDA